MKTYFLGIAGAGVSALASILQTEGHEVIGSDAGVYPPISDYLDGLGIKYSTEFCADNVPDDIDLAIIGTTSKIDPAINPEYKKIIALGVPCYSFAEYLGVHTKGRELLVVAGSFGKSSITALIAAILKSSGRDCGWFVGAIAKDLSVTGNWGKDDEFILEGDEYVVSLSDRSSKFELYSPKDILISSIVHDHVNMFPTMGEYENCFAKLLAKSPEDGLIFACDDYEPIQRLVEQTGVQNRTIFYGLECKTGFHVENIEIGEITKFDLCTPNHGKIPLATSQLGMHNIENIVAASAYCLTKNLIDAEQLQIGVAGFNGVLRRLDKKTTTSKVPVYEGFGSSYEKARSAIEAMELHFPSRPLWVVFEPHTFSWRNSTGLKWYDSVFAGVAQVIMLPPPTHGAALHEQVSIDEIIARVKAAGIAVELAENAESATTKLSTQLNGDETVLLLSSGPLDGLANTLPPILDANFS
ncbi:MAG: UDP-N-acetylmuramate: L-alanyl-gamma-D-glutamyl-meso-diaminopimelate ligase [Hyphomonadaceae bacterium]|nr:MAG: UDP-N-acetylmuramate: L-alanyl-gamma-D-glutamyl-meso-diaminopimelate ligase [Hyphomonadaceae bacterium]